MEVCIFNSQSNPPWKRECPGLALQFRLSDESNKIARNINTRSRFCLPVVCHLRCSQTDGGVFILFNDAVSFSIVFEFCDYAICSPQWRIWFYSIEKRWKKGFSRHHLFRSFYPSDYYILFESRLNRPFTAYPYYSIALWLFSLRTSLIIFNYSTRKTLQLIRKSIFDNNRVFSTT